MKALFIVLGILVLLAGAGGWYWVHNSAPAITFKTAEVKRGQMLATISATGSIEPEAVVDVGAQVAGLIVSFGNDANGKPVDYDSPVKAGSVMAKIDDAVYRADRDIAKAQLEQAKATVKKADADLLQAQALQYQAEQNWLRAQKIGQGDALSKNDYDMYQANFKSTAANVEVARAELDLAKTGIAQAQATLDKAQRNLDFCTIASPVDGVIISRRVNIGQTVVSSLNAPSLFLIAKDLHKMQIWVAVNEADIEQIKAGQNVTFTCDGIPNRIFQGKVNKVRLNAQTTQNVVTYTVEVNFNNDDDALKPYKTANVQFELNKDPDVLLVPNAALRWYPSDKEEVAPEARDQWKPVDEDDEAKPADAGAPQQGPKPKGKKKPVARNGLLWVSDGQHVHPLKVQVGPTDAIQTEVSGADLKAGQQVVVGEVEQSSADGQERNPFLPQMHRHK
jgi:HlyD family secretion protein